MNINCDLKICVSCKFFLWNKQLQTYECNINGCYENSKFKEYTILEK
jgi:hypothetical protein